MTAADLPVKVGDVLASKYRVERVIGVGGMGVVLEAEHVTLHHRVALKLMLPAAAAEPDAVQRFLREARAAAQLRSEHVARVLDVGTLDKGEPFMVMELLEGQNLEEVLRAQGPLPVADAVTYLREACDAVAEAHERGVVHRDLKPGNLFLAKDARGREQIKVLDFGISKHTAGAGDLALTKTTTVMGSPLYMSPEQMRATRDVDARTDVWSLGVTLHELLAGTVPFFSDSAMELGAKVLHEQPASLEGVRPDVPPALAEVVRRCLEKDPAQRFASVRDLSASLQDALAGVEPPNRSTQVRVTRVTGADASALPYSHTTIAHTRTAGEGRPSPRRPLLFVALTAAAVGVIGLVLRARSSYDAPRAAEGADVVVASALEASVAASSAPPRTADAPDAQLVIPVVSSAVPPSRPRAPGRRPARAADAGGAPAPPPTTPPAPTASSNPLDHM